MAVAFETPVAEPIPLPDIANTQPAVAPAPIDRVGMEGIDLPVTLRDRSGAPIRIPARADAFVSLDRADAKGIHMSRLFLVLQEVLGKQELDPAALDDLLTLFVGSHHDISHSAHLAVRFDYLMDGPALRSENSGWKSYPVELSGTLRDGALRLEMGVRVVYSSTCPCSAALSRQLVRDRFLERFEGRRLDVDAIADWLASEDGMCATPHSQRSHADIRVALDPRVDEFPVAMVVELAESALGTPVQSAVKREDEQAFAALNGQNLMFCEDAARKVRSALEGQAWIHDYRIHVRHEESLHPHDAVSVLCKGVEGGFRA